MGGIAAGLYWNHVFIVCQSQQRVNIPPLKPFEKLNSVGFFRAHVTLIYLYKIRSFYDEVANSCPYLLLYHSSVARSMFWESDCILAQNIQDPCLLLTSTGKNWYLCLSYSIRMPKTAGYKIFSVWMLFNPSLKNVFLCRIHNSLGQNENERASVTL